MATTSLTVLPKKTGPSDALRNLSIANYSPQKTSPKDQYINSVTNTGATTPNRTTMMSQLDTAKNQLMQMKEIADARVAAERGTASTGTTMSGPSNALREMSSAISPRPESTDFYGRANSAMDAYIKSLMPSDEENDVAKRLSNMQNSISSGIQQASEQAIPMGFITGQQQAIENRGLNAIKPVENELARLLAQREARSQGLSARSEFETALAGTRAEEARYQDEVGRDERRYAYDVAREASAPIEFGGSLYQRNPDGGFTEILSAPPEAPEPFELSEGQSRYEFNPETGEYEMIASKGKTYAPKSGSSTTGSDGPSARTSQIIDGFITMDDLTLAERQKVQDELYEMGFGSDQIPQWFKEFEEENSMQSLMPNELTARWKAYRSKVMSASTAESASGGGLEGVTMESLI